MKIHRPGSPVGMLVWHGSWGPNAHAADQRADFVESALFALPKIQVGSERQGLLIPFRAVEVAGSDLPLDSERIVLIVRSAGSVAAAAAISEKSVVKPEPCGSG